MSDLYSDPHYYIDTSSQGWIEELLARVNAGASIATLHITTRQTQGTIYSNRPNARVVMHPADRAKLLREFPFELGSPREWFDFDA